MDYEKAYKNALQKIRDGLQPLPDGAKISGVTRAFLEEVFPELKENEDERIRKALISVFSDRKKYLIDQSFGDITVSEALAWLEKQSEQKPTWSEDDESLLKWTNGNLTELKEQFGEKYGKVGECISWLKSLKERLI